MQKDKGGRLYPALDKHNNTTRNLFVLLGADASRSVGELDVESGGLLHDGLAGLRGNGVCDLENENTASEE